MLNSLILVIKGNYKITNIIYSVIIKCLIFYLYAIIRRIFGKISFFQIKIYTFSPVFLKYNLYTAMVIIHNFYVLNDISVKYI